MHEKVLFATSNGNALFVSLNNLERLGQKLNFYIKSHTHVKILKTNAAHSEELLQMDVLKIIQRLQNGSERYFLATGL